MRKLLVIIMMSVACSAYAQTPGDTTVQNWTREELQKKTKNELTSIYIGEIVELFSYGPFTALQPGDMPENKYLEQKLLKLNKSEVKNAVVMKQNFKDIIPYADKVKIIESIMYFQTINNFLHLL